MFFEDPINLFFFTPHDIPIVAIDFSPFAGSHRLIYAVSERSFEFDRGSKIFIACCTEELGTSFLGSIFGNFKTYYIIQYN